MEQNNHQETAAAAKNLYPYAQRLMANMGWSGQGLGAEENGITEPIRVRTKRQLTGLGFTEKQDHHIDRQDDFNDVLLRLNQSHASETTNVDVGFSSLETKSKSSRHRVHYHKFARGKDLSGRSEQDMQAILGKRGRILGNSYTELVTGTDQSNETAQLAHRSGSPDLEIGRTELGSAEIDEPAAVASPERYSRRRRKVSVDGTVETTDDLERRDAVDSAADETMTSKKSKKKKRNRDDSILMDVDYSNGVEATREAELTADTSISPKKKRKKRKSEKTNEEDSRVADESIELFEERAVVEETGEDAAVDKKKKRKRMEEVNGLLNEADNLDDKLEEKDNSEMTSDSPSQHRKKKRKEKKNNGHHATNGVENGVEHNDASEKNTSPEVVKKRKEKYLNSNAISVDCTDVEQSAAAETNCAVVAGDNQTGATSSDPVQSTDSKAKRKRMAKKASKVPAKTEKKSINPPKGTKATKAKLKRRLKMKMKKSLSNKQSLESLSESMASMFKGSNILKIEGYPVKRIKLPPKK